MHRHYMEKGRSDSGGGFPRQSSPMPSFLAVAPLPFPRRVHLGPKAGRLLSGRDAANPALAGVSAVPKPGRIILHPLLDVC